MSISRKIGLALTLTFAGSFLGIMGAFTSRNVSNGVFSAYQKARIDRQANAGTTNFRVVALDTDNDLDFVQFTSPEVGWVGNHYGLLYTTIDAGKTWQRRDLNVGIERSGLYFSDIHFESESVGWAIAQRYGKPGEDLCVRQGSLLHTNDGGQTWQIKFTKKCVELLRIAFTGEGEGWVIGHEFIHQKEEVGNRFLIMHSLDHGNAWVDISECPNHLMMERDGRVLDYAVGIAATGAGTASLITGNGHILDATENGTQWRPSESLALYSLIPEVKAMSDGSVTVNAGMDGSHGTAGMVARRDPKGKWMGSWFTDFWVKDALFLSSHEMLALGSLLPKDKELLLENQRQGAILLSKNDGLDWTIVFKSTDRRSINAVALNADGPIWAAGSRGLLVELTHLEN